MRIIEIKECEKCCHYFSMKKSEKNPNEIISYCQFAKREIKGEVRIPKWCPLKKCEKPLLKLVAEKEYNISISRRSDKLWEIRLGEKKFIFNQYFLGKTYAEAEQKARKWLEKQ